MYRNSFLLVLLLFLTNSCQKDDQINNYLTRVNFDVSSRLLEGKYITSIDTDTKGNICIASGKELYINNNKFFKSYSLDYNIMDVAIAPDETVWIGTNGGGLAHFTGNGFTWYTAANAGLPRDIIWNVEIAPNGNIWFTSCAFRLGGLGFYDGIKFRFYTPDNSPLNQNIIENIDIDKDGNVYIATNGTVGRTNIYRISDGAWDCLGDEKGMFYWARSFSVGQAGTIFLVEDYSLSSSSQFNNTLFEFRDNKWQKIDTDNLINLDFFSLVRADKRNYCWVIRLLSSTSVMQVYNGKSWQSSPSGTFPDDYITTFEIDNDNNIWVGTSKNGVFIFNQ
jgi:ligand-binding sensor domain-containing protein